VLADVVGQREAPVLDEQEDRRGDELLLRRADVETRARPSGARRSTSARP
jgi:hypothetical protein